MANPSRWAATAWYKAGAAPGQFGNAVISGHLDSDVGPAVFWRLRELVAGDRLSVTDVAGQSVEFVVERTVVYPYDQAPLGEIFGNLFAPRLNLITCRGDFNQTSQNYDERLVVYTRRAQ